MKLSRKELLLLLSTAIIASHAGASSAVGADIASPPAIKSTGVTPSDWSFYATPYVWATSLNGSTTVKGRTTDVNASFIDILQHTQFPKNLMELAGYFEARNGRVSLFADAIYMKLGLGAAITRSRSVDALNGSVGVSAGLNVEMFIAEVAAGYAVAQWGSAGKAASDGAIDLYAGVRGWWQRADASVALAGTLNVGDLTLNADRTLTASGNVGWVDPLLGVRLRQQVAPGMSLVMSGDVGGFGAGSKFSWQTLAAINYDLYVHNNVIWSGMIGYKALYVDYAQGSGLNLYEYKMTMHGPILGLSARF